MKLRDLVNHIRNLWPIGAGVVGITVYVVSGTLSATSKADLVDARVIAIEKRTTRIEDSVNQIPALAADMRAVTVGVQSIMENSRTTTTQVQKLNEDVSDVKATVAALKAAADTRDRLERPSRK